MASRPALHSNSGGCIESDGEDKASCALFMNDVLPCENIYDAEVLEAILDSAGKLSYSNPQVRITSGALPRENLNTGTSDAM